MQELKFSKHNKSTKALNLWIYLFIVLELTRDFKTNFNSSHTNVKARFDLSEIKAKRKLFLKMEKDICNFKW